MKEQIEKDKTIVKTEMGDVFQIGYEINWNFQDDHMNVREKNGVFYLTFPCYDKYTDRITHGFSTRLGGVSKGHLSSMNLGFTRGDEESAVRENYRRIADAIGFSPEDIVTSDQTHTINIKVVTEADRGSGITRPRDFKDIDGLITNVPGLVLTTYFADCVPVFFYDPIRGAIGLSHSGWRGSVHKIAAHTVKLMKQHYGTNPEDLICAIGPSICMDCYEVSEDVIIEVKANFHEKDYDSLFLDKGNGKYQLNLWKAVSLALIESGVRQEQIHLSGICSCCNPEFLFSHRASHGKRGNMAAFLSLTEKH